MKDIKGFSHSNVFYIRRFYQFYAAASVQQVVGLNENSKETTLVQQDAAQGVGTTVQQPVGFNIILGVPWGHHTVLLDKAKSLEEALFSCIKPSNITGAGPYCFCK